MPTSLALFLAVSFPAFTLSHPTVPSGQSVPLHHRSRPQRTPEEWGLWAKAHRERLTAKYGAGQPEKRSTGTNLITNQNSDASFFGSLAIGTPPVSYNVILDTGSADLWLADSNCVTNCDEVATFNPSQSSTFTTNNAAFNISYGSGKASGTIGADNIQMAGFSVSNQTLGLCDTVSDGLLTAPISGLLGLAFKTIASSGATPFWEALVSAGAWDSPVMGFQLTRFINDTTARSLEPGGSFSMGFVNTTLFTGDIEYLELATDPSYWILPLTAMTVQGNSVQVPTGVAAYSAIDTGTTLVGGPAEYMTSMYSQIPGAAPGTGNFDGYYTYPCDTTVNLTVSFGGKSWPISEADFRMTQLTQNQCIGAFFNLQTGRSAPDWIFGDTLLKNVYSVFRYDPPSVGFAQLSNVALAMNGVNAPVPSATVGSVATTVTATGRSGNSGVSMHMPGSSVVSMAVAWTVGLLAGLSILL
ncbi:Cathepsin D [Hypsizygus marmoreus]|uniref:Cathepsin D n=1 Tax=Hypsizygus marmoreus TaxID=39966 RepID=A0A369J1L0_HYPMA|nr:Cathepsin D [Hypsizygus marmoreus]